MKRLFIIAFGAVVATLAAHSPAYAWTYQDCVAVNFQNSDCAKYTPPTPAPSAPPGIANTNSQQQSQQQSQSQTATGGSATATSSSTATGGAGGNGGSASAAGGSVASGAVQNTVYAGGAMYAPVPLQAPLAGCDSRAALSASVNYQHQDGFFARLSSYGGSVGITAPLGRRPAYCTAQVPAVAAPIQPVVVNVQPATALAPATPAAAPVVVYRDRRVLVRPACVPISADRRTQLTSKTDPRGIYRLSRSRNAVGLKQAIREAEAACVDYYRALDGA